MKILFTSYVFSPGIGGIETVSALLAPEFVRTGHEVILVTRTREPDGLSRPFRVVRDPTPLELLKLTAWSDVVFQNNISLELAWPLAFIRRPWIIAHQTWLDHASGRFRLKATLKNFLLRFATHGTISQAVAAALPLPSTVVGNPYDTTIFRPLPGIDRDRELVYVGRLVSDKGVDLLIDALAELSRRRINPRLTIIGSGLERAPLEQRATRLGVAAQIEFVGTKTGEELARLLHVHRVMVIPSRWAEPFGVVALEGIACGCAIVASEIGGLPDAVGPCCLLIPPENVSALADAVERMLAQPDLRRQMQEEATTHLAPFAPSKIAGRYLDLLAQARTS